MKTTKNYIGNKNFPGVIDFLVNKIPKSERYFSLFMGGAGLENSVYTQEATFICSEKDKQQWSNKGNNQILYSCYQDLLEDFNFTAADFIFADPPYMFSSRRSKKKYYKHEFDTPDHIEFLNYIGSCKAKVLITHPNTELYRRYLSGWSIEEFSYMTRAGMFSDCVFTNYKPADIELLNYDGLGKDFIERQAIKRQRANVVNKFKALSLHKRKAIVQALKKKSTVKELAINYTRCCI